MIGLPLHFGDVPLASEDNCQACGCAVCPYADLQAGLSLLEAVSRLCDPHLVVFVPSRVLCFVRPLGVDDKGQGRLIDVPSFFGHKPAPLWMVAVIVADANQLGSHPPVEGCQVGDRVFFGDVLGALLCSGPDAEHLHECGDTPTANGGLIILFLHPFDLDRAHPQPVVINFVALPPGVFKVDVELVK